MKLDNIAARYITNDVLTAVWIAALIKTYDNFEVVKNKNYWLTQRSIRDIASLLCRKSIDPARISQWSNGDHRNCNRNYLRENGALRRLTQINEFAGIKETPHELPLDERIYKDKDITLLDLLSWYKDFYCKLSVESFVSDEAKKAMKEKSPVLEPENTDDLRIRAVRMIKNAWEVFSKKVGGGIVQVNKEASMQLHFAYVIQQMIPLIIYQDDEKIDIELETAVSDGKKIREADIMLYIYKGDELYRIALELKCYRKKASSGGNRGAGDIFMKDIYMDLQLLEKYCEHDSAEHGIALIMTDHVNFIYSEKKEGKCWDYDTTHGTFCGNKRYTTDIGGKPVDILLNNRYHFNWKAEGDYFFTLLEKLED